MNIFKRRNITLEKPKNKYDSDYLLDLIIYEHLINSKSLMIVATENDIPVKLLKGVYEAFMENVVVDMNIGEFIV